MKENENEKKLGLLLVCSLLATMIIGCSSGNESGGEQAEEQTYHWVLLMKK